MVKTLHKCILSSLVSNLQATLTEKSCTSVRRPNQATPIFHVYQGVGVENYVDNLCCELCCSFIIKTPALSMGPNFKLIEDGEFLLDVYRCCQRCPRDADDILNMYIPKIYTGILVVKNISIHRNIFIHRYIG